MYSCHLFLISSASVRSLLFLSFIVLIYAWNFPLECLISLKRSLVFPILLFSSISFHSQRRQWQPTPVHLPWQSHGWRSLVGCTPWGRWESDTTERLHFDFSLSCIGQGNGNPLQCSCLENPREGGAGPAAVYGVTQRLTWLRRLSSSFSLFIEEDLLISSCYYLELCIQFVMSFSFSFNFCFSSFLSYF